TRAFLDLVRAAAGIATRARVISRNEFPTASGLASSASGYAALAVAAAGAAGLAMSPRQLSILARRGSGSAARSVFRVRADARGPARAWPRRRHQRVRRADRLAAHRPGAHGDR